MELAKCQNQCEITSAKGDLILLTTKQLQKGGADLVVPLIIANLLDYNLIYDRLGGNNLRHFKVPVRRRKIIFDCNLKVVFLDQTKVPEGYSCCLCKKDGKKKPKSSRSFQYEALHIINFHKDYFFADELISNIQYLEFQSLSLQGFDFSLFTKG